MAIMKNVEISWAKIIGPARPKYNPRDGNEWSVDLNLTEAQLKALAKEGFTTEPFLKTSKDGKTKYVRYSRDEKDKDGRQKTPVLVRDASGAIWPQDKLLGNGTVVDIKYKLTDPYKIKNETRVKLVLFEVMVRKHVPYEAAEDFEYSATDVATEDWGD